jgi:hypothetical protein
MGDVIRLDQGRRHASTPLFSNGYKSGLSSCQRRNLVPLRDSLCGYTDQPGKFGLSTYPVNCAL